MVTDFMKYYLNLTYKQHFIFRIQGLRVRSENNPNELAAFKSKQNSYLLPHSQHTHTHTHFKDCTTIQQEL